MDICILKLFRQPPAVAPLTQLPSKVLISQRFLWPFPSSSSSSESGCKLTISRREKWAKKSRNDIQNSPSWSNVKPTADFSSSGINCHSADLESKWKFQWFSFILGIQFSDLLVAPSSFPLGLVSPRIADADHRQLARRPRCLDIHQFDASNTVSVTFNQSERSFSFRDFRIRLLAIRQILTCVQQFSSATKYLNSAAHERRSLVGFQQNLEQIRRRLLQFVHFSYAASKIFHCFARSSAL